LWWCRLEIPLACQTSGRREGFAYDQKVNSPTVQDRDCNAGVEHAKCDFGW
jgi:hypothetical protein